MINNNSAPQTILHHCTFELSRNNNMKIPLPSITHHILGAIGAIFTSQLFAPNPTTVSG